MALESGKIVMCYLTRDEPDMLEDGIAHHISQGVDGFIVTNHVSIAANHAVLAKFPDKIIASIDKPEDDVVAFAHGQTDWRCNMAELAVKAGAEWVIVSDTDEFWYGLAGLRNIKDFNTVAVNQFFEHIPTAHLLATERPTRADLPYYKPHPQLRDNSHPRLMHRVIPDGGAARFSRFQVVNPPVLAVKDTSFHIRHYPIRSYERFVIKATTGQQLDANIAAKRPGWSRVKWLKAHRKGNLPNVYKGMLLNEREAARLEKAGQLLKYVP